MKKKKRKTTQRAEELAPQAASVEPQETSACRSGTVQIGDRVRRKPITFGAKGDCDELRSMTGTVVYVHPKGRYHTVEFKFGEQAIRESFAGTAI
ncbi:MAG: hypothetical protein IKB82_08295 [Clostridia bacterium]|nr:hypothetical protein [Clostridia bacterium]